MTRESVAIFSGGLDSTVLAYYLRARGDRLHLLSLNYGQRHVKELDFAARTALLLQADWQLLDLTALKRLLKGSALTDDIAVPDGHYAAANMSVTIVPNRNAILLAVAAAWALSLSASEIYLAVHAGDHTIYPDCRPEFVAAVNDLNRVAFAESVTVHAPFATWHKADIVAEGARLGVPFADTWSCYKGGLQHCGTCGTCVERREAFQLAGVADPTSYLS